MTAAAPQLRFPRAARLLRPQDFTLLRQGGRRLVLRYFQCEYRVNALATARLGMAVSRRVSKHAVVRNRIRRQIRESFRLQRAALPHCDVLVIARSQSAHQSNAILRADLVALWLKLGEVGNDAYGAASTAQTPLPATHSAGTMRGLS